MTSKKRGQTEKEGGGMEALLADLKAVEKAVCLKKSKIYRMVGAGDFPKPLKIGGATRWRIEEVQKWVEEVGK